MVCRCCGCETDEDCGECLVGDTLETFADDTLTCCRTSEVDFEACGTVTYLGIAFIGGVEGCVVEYADCDPPFEYLEGQSFIPNTGLTGYCCDGVCQKDPCEEPLSIPQGPGTELTKIIAWMGLTPAPGCKCKKRARYMDKMGCDWCEQNMSQIVGWLQEEHARTKSIIPFVSFAAEKLVRLAVRRARQGNSQ